MNRTNDLKDILILNTSSGRYVSASEFKEGRLQLPLIFSHQNETLFFINSTTHTVMNSCILPRCAYSESFANTTSGKLVYPLDMFWSKKSGGGFPDFFVVDAMNGEIVFSFIRDRPTVAEADGGNNTNSTSKAPVNATMGNMLVLVALKD